MRRFEDRNAIASIEGDDYIIIVSTHIDIGRVPNYPGADHQASIWVMTVFFCQ